MSDPCEFIKLLRECGVDPQLYRKHFDALFQEVDCLHPNAPHECTGSPINSHSISKAAAIMPISSNGHVHSFSRANPNPLLELSAKRIGVQNASTFRGFCSKHDEETFRLIDSLRALIDAKWIFFASYRALCKSVFSKRIAKRSIEILVKILPDYEIECADYIEQARMSYLRGEEDLLVEKATFDAHIVSGHYDAMKYVIIRCSGTPTIACSHAVSADQDFLGRQIQNLLSDARVVSTFIHCMPTVNGQAIVIAWLAENCKVNCSLVQSLYCMDKSELPNAIIRFLFEYSDNVYFRSSWWESRTSNQREALTARMLQSGPQLSPDRVYALRPDGHRYVDWRFVSIESTLDWK